MTFILSMNNIDDIFRTKMCLISYEPTIKVVVTILCMDKISHRFSFVHSLHHNILH